MTWNGSVTTEEGSKSEDVDVPACAVFVRVQIFRGCLGIPVLTAVASSIASCL